MKKTFALIFSLLFSYQIFALDIANISIVRLSSKVKHSDNGNYTPLEYLSNDDVADLLEMTTSTLGAMQKNSIIPWEDVANTCAAPKIKDFLKSIDFLNPEISLQNLNLNLIKEIYSRKEKLIECGISDVLFNIGQEDLLPGSQGLGFKQFYLTSFIVDFSGRFMKIRNKATSTFRTENTPLNAVGPRLKYADNFKIHTKKIFDSIE